MFFENLDQEPCFCPSCEKHVAVETIRLDIGGAYLASFYPKVDRCPDCGYLSQEK